jgi:molybdate transport system substrate-binding protein
MRRELALVGGHAFEHRPRLLHFLVEFGQQQIGNGHKSSQKDDIVRTSSAETETEEKEIMRTWSRISALAAAVCVAAWIAGTAVDAAELAVVVSGGPLPNVMGTLVSMFERSSGHKVTVSTKAGPAITADVKQGTVDLVVTNAETVADLAMAGDVVSSSNKVLMISKIGVAVKAGAPKPDISTADKLKAALLSAKTVGYSQATSGQHFLTVVERLGIADAVKAKAVNPQQGEPVGALVARGSAEIGVQQVAELLPVPGIDFVGVLPGDLQKRIPYAAGIPTKAKDGAAARALLDFLRSEPALAVLKQKGMDLP